MSGASRNDRKLLEKCPMQVDLPTLSSRGGLGKPPEEERRVALPGTRCFDHERMESDPVDLANCAVSRCILLTAAYAEAAARPERAASPRVSCRERGCDSQAKSVGEPR